MRVVLCWAVALLSLPLAALGERDFHELERLYQHLHSHPELSHLETQTARLMARHFRQLGMRVTTGVGGTGVVGVLKNGAGPTLMLRADMDALPVLEQTGLAHASRVRMVNREGVEQPVMHACGHDIHMTVLIGALRELIAQRQDWSGTLMAIAQPAEEVGQGARRMLADGLFKRFPRPDYNLALHVSADMATGTIGLTPGYALANVDSVDIIVKGVGGHGAYPHRTRDPVVLAAQIVLALQTITSREISPLDPAVVTVGSLHAGHKHNVISDRAHLQLTVRSYSSDTREQILNAIRRIADGQARSAGLPEDRLPEIVVKDEYTPAAYNHPELAVRLLGIFRTQFGTDAVQELPPVMGGEDFGLYGRVEPMIPSLIFWLGAVAPQTIARAREQRTDLPSLHSAIFAPDALPAIRTGVKAMSAAVRDLLSSTSP